VGGATVKGAGGRKKTIRRDERTRWLISGGWGRRLADGCSAGGGQTNKSAVRADGAAGGGVARRYKAETACSAVNLPPDPALPKFLNSP
jgi:hypothetical protein